MHIQMGLALGQLNTKHRRSNFQHAPLALCTLCQRTLRWK